MRRRLARPFGQSISATRVVSLLMGLLVLAMIYQRAGDPGMWTWFASPEGGVEISGQQTLEPEAAGKTTPAVETVVAGPNDQDAGQQQEFQSSLELITDRAPLRPREMFPYWQLMAWSRTKSTRELERRAAADPAFTLLWEQPQKYRGQLINLRLHVRRVLKYDAPENSLGLKEVYEAWGWTDESKSFPYVVVFADKPEGLPVGNRVEADILFSGYFLKIMSYTAFDIVRGAPLMVGRVRMARGGGGNRQPESSPLTTVVAVVLIVTSVTGAWGWWQLRRSSYKPAVSPTLINSEFNAETWFQGNSLPVSIDMEFARESRDQPAILDAPQETSPSPGDDPTARG